MSLHATIAPASTDAHGVERRDDLRNIVIIAHVDHGKTTLVDCLLRQSGQFRESQLSGEQILDSNDQERERGITILAKNIALPYKGVKVNIIDTPGHADFGGEVERVLRMADGALLLVDAAEGPMPQTRFVLSKALEVGLRVIVVINKIDRPDARPAEALDEAMELIMELGGDEMLNDLPFIFSSSKQGFATSDWKTPGTDMTPMLDLVLDRIPGPEVRREGPFAMHTTTLDWSAFVGRIAIGRVHSGTIKKNQAIAVLHADGSTSSSRVNELFVFENLGRVPVESADAGEVVAITGMERVDIGDTICDPNHKIALPRVHVDEPTVEMIFSVNSSPIGGKEGKYVTSRQIRERLHRELEKNVALRVRQLTDSDAYAVSGRGVLHLSVLIETMRREGFELSVGKPRVITRKNDEGKMEEPFETLVVEVPSDKTGPVMEIVGGRRGELKKMGGRGDYTHLEFEIPARGLIGLRTRMLNATQGTAIVHHRFAGYRVLEGDLPGRPNGVLVSMTSGKANAYGLDGLQARSDLFVGPGMEVYEGMIVGENVRAEDMIVNPTKEKKLTNMRASGTDENIMLKPPRAFSLEAALEYIEDDELVEITPTKIRIRKVLLKEHERKRANSKSN